MVENLHRQDLNPLEEAAAYQQLIEDFELTHDRLASRVGKSRVTITNTLRLFQLPPTIQRLVEEAGPSPPATPPLLADTGQFPSRALANHVVTEGCRYEPSRRRCGSHQEGGRGVAGVGPGANPPRELRQPKPVP